MKTKKILFFFPLYFFLLLLGACTKEDGLTTNQLLTNRSQKIWLLQSVTLNGDELLQDCEKDNEWVFYQNNDLVLQPGFVRCFLNEEEVKAIWFFGGAGSNVIYINFPPRIAQNQQASSFITKMFIREITEDVLKCDVIEEAEFGERLFVFKYNFIKKNF